MNRVMLNPKFQRYAERIQDLSDQGKKVAKLEKSSGFDQYTIRGEDLIRSQAWVTNVGSILAIVFGLDSIHYNHFRENIPKEGIGGVNCSSHIHRINGVLLGALWDLEEGFLVGQEFIIAGEIFESVLEEAKFLNKKGYKDCAAVLARVVLEDSLKRLARSENIDDNKKASTINDELKKKGVYSKPQWRFIQAWLDIGNAAAHGKFSEYDEGDVTKMIEGIEQFLLSRFQ